LKEVVVRKCTDLVKILKRCGISLLRHLSFWEVAQELNLDRRMVREILRNELCMKRFWKVWSQDFWRKSKSSSGLKCVLFAEGLSAQCFVKNLSCQMNCGAFPLTLKANGKVSSRRHWHLQDKKKVCITNEDSTTVLYNCTTLKAHLHGSPRLINAIESTKVNRVNSSFQWKCSAGLTGEQVGDGQLSFVFDSLWVTHHRLHM
jgi:hypothetical protein